jgi:hypothetical protein
MNKWTRYFSINLLIKTGIKSEFASLPNRSCGSNDEKWRKGSKRFKKLSCV